MRVYALLLFLSVASAASTAQQKKSAKKESARSLLGNIYDAISSLWSGASQPELPFMPGQDSQQLNQMELYQRPVEFPLRQPDYGAPMPMRRPFEPEMRPFEPEMRPFEPAQVRFNEPNPLRPAQIPFGGPPPVDMGGLRNNPINLGFGDPMSMRRPNQPEMRFVPPGNSQPNQMGFPQQPGRFPGFQAPNMGNPMNPGFNGPPRGPFPQQGRKFERFQDGNQPQRQIAQRDTGVEDRKRRPRD